MQPFIHTRIPDTIAPREPVDLTRRAASDEPSVRFEEVLGRELSARREESPVRSSGVEEMARQEPVARQDETLRVDREGPAGREGRRDATPAATEHDGHEREIVSDSKSRPAEAKQARGDAPAEKAERTKADEGDKKESLAPEARKIVDSSLARASARKGVAPGEEEGRTLLMRRIDIVQSMLAASVPSNGIVREVRAALDELRDATQGRNRRFDRATLEALGERLRELGKKVDALKGNTGGFRPEALRDGLFAVAEIASRMARKSDRSSLQGRMDETEPLHLRTAVSEKVMAPQAPATRDMPDTLSSKDGNTASFGFQFGKAANAHDKIEQPATLPRQNPLFEEQLQSLVRNARVVVQDAKNGSFQMRLYPETLGRVNVHLGLEQGTITGRFLVETAEARQVLVEHLADIRDRLSESGISVGEFQVNVRGEERHAHQSEHDVPRMPLPGATVEAGGIYEQHSIRLHDGYIDVTI